MAMSAILQIQTVLKLYSNFITIISPGIPTARMYSNIRISLGSLGPNMDQFSRKKINDTENFG